MKSESVCLPVKDRTSGVDSVQRFYQSHGMEDYGILDNILVEDDPVW